MKTKTMFGIVLCVICAATLMSGCLESGYEPTEDDEYAFVAQTPRIPAATLTPQLYQVQELFPKGKYTPSPTPTPEVKYVHVTPTPTPTSATTTTYSGENGQNVRVGAYQVIRCGYGCNIDCLHNCEVYCGRGCNIDCGDNCVVRCGDGCNIRHGERCTITHGTGCNIYLAYPD